MSASSQEFYDAFSVRLLRDYVRGNPRVQRQLDFLARSIPKSARNVLIIGAGSGESAHFIAKRVAPTARVVATDLSDENRRIGEALFPHPRIEYQRLDITQGTTVRGPFDVIILPDVYEHLPVSARPAVHSNLRRLLGPGGLILLTCPSRWKQIDVHRTGVDLQPVEEIVEVHDLLALSVEVGGTLTYLNVISVWSARDYMHAIVERVPATLDPIDPLVLTERELGGGLRLLRKVARLVRIPYRALRVRVRWLWRQ